MGNKNEYKREKVKRVVPWDDLKKKKNDTMKTLFRRPRPMLKYKGISQCEKKLVLSKNIKN